MKLCQDRQLRLSVLSTRSPKLNRGNDDGVDTFEGATTSRTPSLRRSLQGVTPARHLATCHRLAPDRRRFPGPGHRLDKRAMHARLN